jgi:hypothetical protein
MTFKGFVIPNEVRDLFPSFRPFDGAQDKLQPESRRFLNLNWKQTWMPAFAGMTNIHFA